MTTRATATSRNEGATVIAGRVFTVETITVTLPLSAFANADGSARQVTDTYLIGARGARYLCRPYLQDDGRCEVISMGSGAPLRDKGQRPVKVFVLGDVVEEIRRGA